MLIFSDELVCGKKGRWQTVWANVTGDQESAFFYFTLPFEMNLERKRIRLTTLTRRSFFLAHNSLYAVLFLLRFFFFHLLAVLPGSIYVLTK